MWRAFLAMVVVLVAGCDKPDVVRSMQRLADQTCACRDRACLEGIERDHQEERVTDTRGLAPDDVEALHHANQRRIECRSRILTGHATP